MAPIRNRARVGMSQHPPQPPGPLARKVVAALHKLRRQQVIDLSAWRAARQSADVASRLHTEPSLAELDPVHGVYVYAQNYLTTFIEQLIELPLLAKLTQAYDQAENEYMPLGPPMSPLTRSYFSSWGTFDLGVGLKHESFTDIVIAVCRALNAPAELLALFETLQQSRMGLYRHDGVDGKRAYLSELISPRQHRVIVPSGYAGQAGELWLARLLPPPPVLASDYGVVFTTPYLLGQLDARGRYQPAREHDWLDYLGRTLPTLKSRDELSAYEQFMKRGLNRHYWNEYIFLAYVNHRQDRIYLAGLPDRPESLPHSQQGRDRWEA